MILPNLLIVGAAKSGTTSLHNYLKQHPDIFMTDHKEPHFLINNEIPSGPNLSIILISIVFQKKSPIFFEVLIKTKS